MKIKINNNREIALLDEIKNTNATYFKIGDKFLELTDDITKTNGYPTLQFKNGDKIKYPREKFIPEWAKNLDYYVDNSSDVFALFYSLVSSGAKVDVFKNKTFGIGDDVDTNVLFGMLPNLFNLVITDIPIIYTMKEDLESVFTGANITTIPENVFDNCPNIKNLGNAFSSTSITSIPENLFNNLKKLENCKECFSSCRNLKSIPSNLFGVDTKIKNIEGIFSSCESITTIPENLFNNLKFIDSYSTCFEMTGITTIPENLFNNSSAKNIVEIAGTFTGCDNLKSIPSKLLDKLINLERVQNCFFGCKNVTSNIPVLWDKTKYPNIDTNFAYASGCTKAANYSSIPADWK